MAGKDGRESVLVTRQTARSIMALGIENAEDDGDDDVVEVVHADAVCNAAAAANVSNGQVSKD